MLASCSSASTPSSNADWRASVSSKSFSTSDSCPWITTAFSDSSHMRLRSCSIIFNRVLLAANYFSVGIELAFAIPFRTTDYPQAIHRSLSLTIRLGGPEC
ncbi:hypothetical protein T01_11563 [Trichinella spiralis]|uniref:Uncharacterized protein n=1 Tax=Trichinella spiralis TaxID=6334 RepID=A0A0V1AP65_TRISP|nr:hypothetical protein T01_11563 [Trichinella spiralis]